MKRNRQLLLIEDDIVDAMTVKRACAELEIGCDIIHKQNGEEALEYLRSDDTEGPSLVLLDLNMPRMNGIEFLEAAKQDRDLKKIPVIVLTTSNDNDDKDKTYGLGIAGYFVKPSDYSNFLKIADEINKYWSLSELPVQN